MQHFKLLTLRVYYNSKPL